MIIYIVSAQTGRNITPAGWFIFYSYKSDAFYTCCSIVFDETVATLFGSIGTTPSSELHLRSEVRMLESRILRLFFSPLELYENSSTKQLVYPQLQLHKFLNLQIKDKSRTKKNLWLHFGARTLPNRAAISLKEDVSSNSFSKFVESRLVTLDYFPAHHLGQSHFQRT